MTESAEFKEVTDTPHVSSESFHYKGMAMSINYHFPPAPATSKGLNGRGNEEQIQSKEETEKGKAEVREAG